MGFWDFLKGNNQTNNNKYNKTFYWGLNGLTNNDDTDLKKYIDDGYNINGDVFSIVNQMSSKFVSIPFYIKKIEDEESNKKYNRLLKATNYNPTFTQKIKTNQLELKALSKEDYPMPFERPNPNQTWEEFFKLTYSFLKMTGNFYWYKLMPENGINAGEPQQLYCLPAHLMKIYIRKDANMLGSEDVIEYFEMDYYNRLTRFERNEVIHVSIDNPNYGQNGEQLYGQSPLRAVWKNVLASNKGLDLNIEMLRNAGVFGFIHAKGQNLSDRQQKGLKDRMNEAKVSKEDLSNIMASSGELAFTRISLTSDELKIFEHLKYNQKMICNALGWSDSLLNNDDGGKHDKQELELKRVLINTTVPDSNIIAEAFKQGVLNEIKGYKDTILLFDYKELPEMQEDLETMSKRVVSLVADGIMNRKEARFAMRLEEIEDANLSIFTVKDDIMSLEDAILPSDDLTLNE